MYMHEPQKIVLTKLDYIVRLEPSSYFCTKSGLTLYTFSVFFAHPFDFAKHGLLLQRPPLLDRSIWRKRSNFLTSSSCERSLNCIANTTAPYRRVFKLSGETRSTQLHFRKKTSSRAFFLSWRNVVREFTSLPLKTFHVHKLFRVCHPRVFSVQPKTADRSERRHLLLVLLFELPSPGLTEPVHSLFTHSGYRNWIHFRCSIIDAA